MGKVGIVDPVLLDEFSAECGLTEPFRVEVGLKGDSATQLHEFRQPFLVIGRRAGSDLMLDHWLVSRRHAYLQLIEGRFFCVDLGSRTGTHGGDATERSGWLDPVRAIQIGPYSVRPALPPVQDRDYPPLPVVTWTIPARDEGSTLWTMNRGLALVGRSPACRIRIPDSDVSRFHCGLVLTTSGVWAIDLLSQRPIVVNGRPVRFARIEPGDELQVGHHVLTPHYDVPIVKLTAPKPSTKGPAVDLTMFASIEPPDPLTDQLPALSPTVIVPNRFWDRPSGFDLAADEASMPADPTVANLVQQFGAMQQQMFDQFHQTMMMMFEGFAKLHRETSTSIREEFEEVRKLSQEIESLRAETARLAEATTMSLQQSALDKVEFHQGPPKNGHSKPPEPPPRTQTQPPPKVVPPMPDPQTDFHAQLCQRLTQIESERQTRWQKIFTMMASKS